MGGHISIDYGSDVPAGFAGLDVQRRDFAAANLSDTCGWCRGQVTAHEWIVYVGGEAAGCSEVPPEVARLTRLLTAIDVGQVVVFGDGTVCYRYEPVTAPEVLRQVDDVLRRGLAVQSGRRDDFGGHYLTLTGAGGRLLAGLRAVA